MKSGISPRHCTMDVAEFDGLPLAVTLIHRAPGAQPVALDGRSAARTAADRTEGAGIKSSPGSASSTAAVVAAPDAGVPDGGGGDGGVPQPHTVANIESSKAPRRACMRIPNLLTRSSFTHSIQSLETRLERRLQIELLRDLLQKLLVVSDGQRIEVDRLEDGRQWGRHGCRGRRAVGTSDIVWAVEGQSGTQFDPARGNLIQSEGPDRRSIKDPREWASASLSPWPVSRYRATPPAPGSWLSSVAPAPHRDRTFPV